MSSLDVEWLRMATVIELAETWIGNDLPPDTKLHLTSSAKGSEGIEIVVGKKEMVEMLAREVQVCKNQLN